MRKVLSAFGKLGTLAVIAIAFVFGLAATVYLSLRSPEISVPEVVNQSYGDGEKTLSRVGLGIRERAKRAKPDVPPGMILDQSPRPGEVVKAGQTIAVVVSRAPREGEKVFAEPEPENKNESQNTTPNEKGEGENAGAVNRNENQNRDKRPKNTNKNTNSNRNANANSNNQNSGNANRNSNNRNSNNRNTNAGSNRNANANTNANRNRNANANRRP